MFFEKFMKLTWIVTPSSLWDDRPLSCCELYTDPYDRVPGTRRFPLQYRLSGRRSYLTSEVRQEQRE
jgi:hypothetical protein